MLRARTVLHDSRFALENLRKFETPQEYRVWWVCGITLCRAVGHVLQKVDSKEYPKIAELIKKSYSSWKDKTNDEHRIFRDFIEQERCNVIKEYEFGYDDGPLDLWQCNDMYSIVDFYCCAMKSGPYYGVDSIKLLEQALNWWDVQLTNIETYIDYKQGLV